MRGTFKKKSSLSKRKNSERSTQCCQYHHPTIKRCRVLMVKGKISANEKINVREATHGTEQDSKRQKYVALGYSLLPQLLNSDFPFTHKGEKQY